jgi:hypothetical protein
MYSQILIYVLNSLNQCWLDKQHMIWWQGLAGTQRQALELTSGPRTAAKTMILPFNRAQSRVVIGLLTRHTLRRHLHVVGLTDSSLCRKCGAENETSDHVSCECEALATLRYISLRSFFLGREDIRSLSPGAIWNFFQRPGLSWLGPNEGAQEGL